MATDKLTGNMPTEIMAGYLHHRGVELNMDAAAFQTAVQMAESVFVGH
jgi:hypothetical protein